MYKKFMDLSIKYKLMFSFGIILIIFLGISGSQVYIGRQSINQFTAAHNEYAAPAQDVAKAYAYLNKATAQVEEVILITNAAEKRSQRPKLKISQLRITTSSQSTSLNP